MMIHEQESNIEGEPRAPGTNNTGGNPEIESTGVNGSDGDSESQLESYSIARADRHDISANLEGNQAFDGQIEERRRKILEIMSDKTLPRKSRQQLIAKQVDAIFKLETAKLEVVVKTMETGITNIGTTVQMALEAAFFESFQGFFGKIERAKMNFMREFGHVVTDYLKILKKDDLEERIREDLIADAYETFERTRLRISNELAHIIDSSNRHE